jgi:hypothetical protein
MPDSASEITVLLKALPEFKRHRLINNLLLSGQLEFTRLAEMYTGALEEESSRYQSLAADLTAHLGLFWRSASAKHPNKITAAKLIMESGYLDGTRAGKECEELVASVKEGKQDNA